MAEGLAVQEGGMSQGAEYAVVIVQSNIRTAGEIRQPE